MSWLSQLVRFLRDTRSGKSSAPEAKTHPALQAPHTWMNYAKAEVGFKEKPGNRGIEKYIKLAKTGSIGDPWCAIFVNAVLEACGYRGSKSAMARSFETHPNFYKLDGPAYGAIVCMWRGSKAAGTGHVAFYLGHNSAGQVIGLGGNQNDGVTDDQVLAAARITGFYWPKDCTPPTMGLVRLGAVKGKAGTEV